MARASGASGCCGSTNLQSECVELGQLALIMPRTALALSSCIGWSAASVSKRGIEAWPYATVIARIVVLAPHLSEESSRGLVGDRRHAADHLSEGPQTDRIRKFQSPEKKIS